MKQAFVIPRSVLIDAGLIPSDIHGKAIYHRFKNLAEFDHLATLAEKYGSFRERGGTNDVEQDPSVQQLIIYGYIQLANGTFMLYQRGSRANSEQRLAGKVSLGIGGHMEPSDLSLMDSFYRELDEETCVEQDRHEVQFVHSDGTVDISLMRQYIDITPVGVIKDERDEVGKAHLGITCSLTPKQSGLSVSIRAETGENIRSFFVTPNEYLRLVKDTSIEPEGWTDIVFRGELTHHSKWR